MKITRASAILRVVEVVTNTRESKETGFRLVGIYFPSCLLKKNCHVASKIFA